MKLWKFATQLYAMPGVASACLSLQDEHAVDVNQLLFAAWMGFDRGIVLGPDDLQAAAVHVHEWRINVVRPLREVRRRMKGSPLQAFHAESADLREQVKRLELRAEKLQLEALEAIADATFEQSAAAGSAATAARNMGALLRMQENAAIPPDVPAVRQLAQALERMKL